MKETELKHEALRKEAMSRGFEIRSRDIWCVVRFLEAHLGIPEKMRGECRNRLKHRVTDLIAALGVHGQGMGVVTKRTKDNPRGDFYKSDSWRILRYEALRLHGGKCQLCGATRADGVRIHVDHIKPRSKYPELALQLSNLQLLCEPCNMGKSNYDDTDWRNVVPLRKAGS